MFFSDINYLAVVLAGIANMILGYLWFGPFFAKPWLKLLALTEEQMKAQNKNMGMILVLSFLFALITATIYQSVYMAFNPADMTESIMLAVIIWFGLIFGVMFNQSLYVKKPFKLIMIDSGYYLGSLIIWSLLYFFML